MIKRITLIITIFLVIFMNLRIAHAETPGLGGNTGYTTNTPCNRNNPNGNNDGNGDGACVSGSGGVPIYGARLFLDNVKEEVTISESLYDTKGKYIGEAIEVQNKLSVVAGRFLGIDAYEEYEKTFTIRIEPFCDYHQVNCLHKDTVPDWGDYCAVRNVKGRCIVPGHRPIERTYKSDFSCDPGDAVTGCTYYYCASLSPQCYYYTDGNKNREINGGCPDVLDTDTAEYWLNKYVKTIDTEHSYTAKRQDVNDINEGKNEFDDADIKVGYYGQFYMSGLNILASNKVSKTGVLRYSYNVQKACINPFTAEVVYVRKVNSKGEVDEEPCPEYYIAAPDIVSTKESGTRFPGSHVGEYFIPLNTKSTDKLQYNLIPNAGKKKLMSSSLCRAIIDKYPNDGSKSYSWLNIIVDKDGNSYPDNISVVDAKKQIWHDQGCYMAYLATYSVEQKFYNETVENGKTYLNGYAFYYRQIDYKEPFPNPISTDSIWYGLYDAKTNKINVTDANGKTETINLNNSYSTVSYKTNEDYNTKTIRNYNNITNMNIEDDLGVSERIYTSWDGMFPRGTSKFVADSSYGIDRVNCGSVYALGCGPANANWEECKKGKSEVCRQ